LKNCLVKRNSFFDEISSNQDNLKNSLLIWTQ